MPREYSSQSASRTFLARLIPAGREGEVFGLYATTGRAATFLAFVTFGAGESESMLELKALLY